MTIEPHSGDVAKTDNRRSTPRRRIRLRTSTGAGTPESSEALILDISETGLLLQSAAPLAIGADIECELPEVGLCQARVAWVGAGLYGCQFKSPISASTVSAARLKSQPDSAIIEPAAPQPGPHVDEHSFGARLSALRRQRGMSMASLARAIGVSKPALWKWENGAASPRRSSVEALSAALNVSVHELLAGDGLAKDLQSPDNPMLEILNSKIRISKSLGIPQKNVEIIIKI